LRQRLPLPAGEIRANEGNELTQETASPRTAKAKSFFSKRGYHARNYVSARRSEIVRELAAGIDKSRVLDLGSGSGIVSLPLLDAIQQLTLVDFSETALEIAQASVPAKRRKDVDIRRADLLAFRAEERFNLVLSVGVLAHVDSTDRLFEAITANLVPGGHAIVQLTPSDNVLNWLWLASSSLRGLKLRPTNSSDIIASARRHGLRLVDRRRHLLVLPGVNKLLGSKLLPYDRWVSRTPLAKLGTSDFLLFERE